ncbi:hypothetical protein EVJ58_g66 [Rhodofomes roseus]|uniref:DNA helicase n=1 Tax=Rhodofomes roseus TaxID=34475 RepID=A0A4Y9Z9P2_9APHY|nr:hypothetical protein EVJ58_g66 [Rhodofomes roseus]
MSSGKATAKLSRRLTYDDGIEPTELWVHMESLMQHPQLDDPRHLYIATDRPGLDHDDNPYPPHKVKLALGRLISPKEITLKVGAQVMLIKNLVQGRLVNGSVGRVAEFTTPREARSCGTDIAREVPEGPQPSSQRQIKEKRLLQAAESGVWPIVEFQNGLRLLCIPAIFEATDANGSIEAIREQVPLILAWALSIHKSQGQTLDRVRVDLRRTFETGQVYVALSRATSLDTLEVQNFNPLKVRAHDRVIRWMDKNITSNEVLELKTEADPDSDDDCQYWDKVDDLQKYFTTD